jgi:hypothetical protein
MQQENQYFVQKSLVDDDIEPWKRLENVVRIWAAQSGFEKDQEFYTYMKIENAKTLFF